MPRYKMMVRPQPAPKLSQKLTPERSIQGMSRNMGSVGRKYQKAADT